MQRPEEFDLAYTYTHLELKVMVTNDGRRKLPSM